MSELQLPVFIGAIAVNSRGYIDETLGRPTVRCALWRENDAKGGRVRR
jgi:hypothetical protein